jgi:hypothetical protein
MLFILFFYSCENDNKEEFNLNLDGEIDSNSISNYIFKHTISGDFNGDGVNDTLTETLISSIDQKSIDELPVIEYDSLVGLIHKKEPILSLRSANKNIPELFISKGNAAFGLLWLKNEGDLNNDGIDEISIVIDWADWSQVNHSIIYTLKNGEWVELMKFEIREWQIQDSIDNNPFQGFITKNENGEFMINTFDSEVNEVKVPLKKSW